ncbi:DUF1489 family protein [Marinibacterium profundimaris]|uniref:Lysophospholipase n=1 Tax=Marinibacterium profundimaris TaxID=1679460 RepID=A0A225NDM6_9RHOB|nr:DUF1489 domain-containing protein [Marinibacterium profundimaris]OWU70347.1 lysophospholipase [Marinibacterium profundimaris]
MDKTIHLVKLCVGAAAVEDLEHWQATARARGTDGLPRHVTRMWPRREAELLNGGSLFWVFKGLVLCRQQVLRLDPVTGSDGIERCGIVLEHEVTRTRPLPRRPFQGWRYLTPEDAPEDLPAGHANDDALPPKLAAELADIGVR